MLWVAVCDDNAHVCAQLKEFCAAYLGKAIEYELLIFNDGLALTHCKQDINILFLDVEMPYIDGFQAARELAQRSPETRIIFLTNHAEMMQKAFKVKAFRYLIKPVSETDLRESMADALKDLNANTKVIVDCITPEGKTEVLVNERDILYVEAIGDSTVVYTVNQGDLLSRRTLKYWTENLSETAFFQTHKSFVVSLAQIASMGKSSVAIIAKSREIPLSKRNAAVFKERVAEYIKRL